jgi:glycosyltransferase involved in cell wall biosynthesis
LREQHGQECRLIFIGGCDPRLAGYQQSLRQYARALLLYEDEVVFAGSVTQSQLRTYYAAADTFLCTSEHEGFCVPLVEAMLLRVPIVAWARTAVGETVGNAGLVWEEDDPDLLAESLAAVLESSSLRRTLVEWGFRRYREHFAVARIEQRFLAMVEGLLSSTQDYRKIHA